MGSATTNASGVATLAAPSSLAGINAGSYPAGVTATFTADASYSGQTASNSLTVTKAQLSVKADDKSKAYDGAVFTGFTSTISGFVSGQTEAGLRGSGALTGAAAYSGAGTTAVNASLTPYVVTPTLGTLTATNYTFAFLDGNLTISNRAITVTADAKTKTYGAANPALDAVVVGAVGGDTVNYSLATAARDFRRRQLPDHGDAGEQPELHGHDDRSDADGQSGGGDGDGQRKSKTYGAANPALDAAVTGAVNGDTLDYSLATTAVLTSGVGSYPITVTLGTNPNYTVTHDRSDADGHPAAATVTANAKSKTYGAANPVLDAAVAGAVERRHPRLQPGDDGGLTSGVGSYPIAVTLGINPNYTVTTTDATLTVNPAAATVTANAKSKTYGAANPALDAVVTGAVNGDTLDYSLATTALATSGVGGYPITVTLGTNPNYTVTTTDADADGQSGGGDGDGQREEQDLRRGQPGAGCGGDRRRQRRHARLQPGDDGARDLRRRQLPDRGDARAQPELHGHARPSDADGRPAAATVTANAKSKTYGDGQPGAGCGGDRRRQRRHARLQPGDDGDWRPRASAATRSR